MSSNRVIIDSNGRQFNSDSFDRFGDDLCELLLSYLTFEDKIRLQCVSKQWKRTILNKQYVVSKINNIDIFFRFLKKCNINEIDLSCLTLNDHTLKKIIKYCPRLQTMFADFTRLSAKAIKRFGQKLGLQMKGIHFRGKEDSITKSMLNMCPNLEEVSFYFFDHKIYGKLKPLMKLKKLHIRTHSFDEKFFDNITRIAPTVNQLIMRSSGNRRLPLTISNVSSPFLHLELLKLYHRVDNVFYFDLPTVMPKLKYLRVASRFIPYPEEFLSISKLTKLTCISLRSTLSDNRVVDEYSINLLLDCCQLKTIKLNYRIYVSNQTIDKLIAIARQRSKQFITFECNRFDNRISINWPKIPNKLIIRRIEQE